MMNWFSNLLGGGHKEEVLRKGGYQPVKSKDNPKPPPSYKVNGSYTPPPNPIPLPPDKRPGKVGNCRGGIVKGLNVPIVGDYSNLAPSVKSSSKSIGEFHVNVTIDPITIDPKAFAESLA
jgi:hypothetical protein